MNKKKVGLPPQGLRNPRGRRSSGGIVPASPASSSREGPVEVLTTGTSTNLASVAKKRSKELPPGDSSREEESPKGPSRASTSADASSGAEGAPKQQRKKRRFGVAPGALESDGGKSLPPSGERVRGSAPEAAQEVPRPGRTSEGLDPETVERLRDLELQVRDIKSALSRVEHLIAAIRSRVPYSATTTGAQVGGSDARSREHLATGAEGWTPAMSRSRRRKERARERRDTTSHRPVRARDMGKAPPTPSERQQVGFEPPSTADYVSAPSRWARGKGKGGASAPTRPGPLPKRQKRRTAPRYAAVTVTATGGSTYAEILQTATEQVDLADMGIDLGSKLGLITKRARNGGYLFEVLGKDSASRADRLARELEEALCGVAKVARPSKCAEMRVVGLDDMATPQLVLRALSKAGACSPSDFRMGAIRRSPGGLGAVWVRCPLAAAVKIQAAGGVSVGWAFARVRLLEERPLQCFRCLNFGHLAVACTAPSDFKGRCFRCGGDGHEARSCTGAPKCLPCERAGRDPAHRMGGRSCPAGGSRVAKARAKAPGSVAGKGGDSRRARTSALAVAGRERPGTSGGSRESGVFKTPAPVTAGRKRGGVSAVATPTVAATISGSREPEAQSSATVTAMAAPAVKDRGGSVVDPSTPTDVASPGGSASLVTSTPRGGREQEGAITQLCYSPIEEEGVPDSQPPGSRRGGHSLAGGQTEMEAEVAGAVASLETSISRSPEWGDSDFF